MPKIPECDRCFLYARNPHLVCAVHPTGPNTNTCIDFRENPNNASEELWEPEGASYYNGELIRPLAKVGGRDRDGAPLRIARAGQSAANVVVG
jgi:hypothetical protein